MLESKRDKIINLGDIVRHSRVVGADECGYESDE
jgi:hypothetical protein